MKKTVLILSAVTVALASANAKKKEPKVTAPVVVEKVFKNDVDSMSYALGLNVGTDFGKNIKNIPGGKSNIELLVKGFTTAMKGDSALMKPEVAMEVFRAYITKAQAAEQAKKKLEGQQFLAENMTKEGVKTTASGLQYQVIKGTEGPKPKATDSVTVHYVGTLTDGKEFDSSIKRGQPITFPLNQVIPGWTEGVQLMSVGSKYKFFVPYTLGYGEQGAGQGAIPGFATLIFEVELLAVKPFVEPAPAADVKAVAAPAKAKSGKAASAKAKSKK